MVFMPWVILVNNGTESVPSLPRQNPHDTQIMLLPMVRLQVLRPHVLAMNQQGSTPPKNGECKAKNQEISP